MNEQEKEDLKEGVQKINLDKKILNPKEKEELEEEEEDFNFEEEPSFSRQFFSILLSLIALGISLFKLWNSCSD